MQAQIKQRLEQIVNNIGQLPSMPDVAGRVVTMVGDPDVAFNKVSEEISKDQAITTNVLKLCNSAYFSRGKEISSIERAAVTLGLKEVKDIVVVAATKSLLDKEIIGYDLAKGELWKHGLAVAVLAKNIANLKNYKDIADIAFTGGIIHDVGKTVLALYVQSAFKEIVETVEQKQITFQLAEKEIMGFDHQEIGEKILQKWSFPHILRDIVRYHHEPENAPEESKLIVSIVHIANTICLMGGIGIGSDGLYHQLSDEAIKAVGMKDAELENIYANLPDVIDQVSAIQ
ncbi:MAG: HDOD domain-containing protein [Spirochaetes bacterium]|nr:HDOD domain-containing protein [Spirochaetota bacterium]